MWFQKYKIVGKWDFSQPAGHTFANVVQCVINLHHCTCTWVIHVNTRITGSFWQSFHLASQSPVCAGATELPWPSCSISICHCWTAWGFRQPFLLLCWGPTEWKPFSLSIWLLPLVWCHPQIAMSGFCPTAHVDDEDIKKYQSTYPSKLKE